MPLAARSIRKCQHSAPSFFLYYPANPVAGELTKETVRHEPHVVQPHEEPAHPEHGEVAHVRGYGLPAGHGLRLREDAVVGCEEKVEEKLQ